VKHSGATQLRCRIQKKLQHIEIEITDNGKGFDMKQITNRSEILGGFGLSGITERVRLLHGTVHIYTPQSSGTTIKITIPYSTIV
jgi:two-component system sensor histidine kinase DegS